VKRWSLRNVDPFDGLLLVLGVMIFGFSLNHQLGHDAATPSEYLWTFVTSFGSGMAFTGARNLFSAFRSGETPDNTSD
jgi:hypothetical protein